MGIKYNVHIEYKSSRVIKSIEYIYKNEVISV